MAAPMPAYVLAVYAAFALVAALIGLAAGRGERPEAADASGSTRRKLPGYVALNLAILVAIWAPDRWQLLPVLLIALGAGIAFELASALGIVGRTRLAHTLLAGSLIALAGAQPVPDVFTRSWLPVSVAALAVTVLAGPVESLGRRLLSLAAAAVYVPWCLAAWLWLWMLGDGGAFAAFLYLAVAAHDAFAQVVGQALGRTPLLPRISPAKTAEGAAGGLVAAAGMGALLAVTLTVHPAWGAALGAACGAAAAVGDLVASAWKRALGVRDFGRALGAQGGLLDRFDGMLPAAVVMWGLSQELIARFPH